MIYVCWADVSTLDESGASYELSDYRSEKLRRMRLPDARRAGVGAELLLQHALRRFRPELPLPPKILCSADGKPYLADRELFFNLSHSGRFAACAVADEPVGLDLQIPCPYQEKLAERFFAPEERLYIENNEDRDATFTALWCRKESFIKATGKGLSAGLDSFSAVPGAEMLFFEGQRFAIRDQRLVDFHLAVCFPAYMKQNIDIQRIELP